MLVVSTYRVIIYRYTCSIGELSTTASQFLNHLFDTGTMTKTTNRRWCFPSPTSNVVLAACAFQKGFVTLRAPSFDCGWANRKLDEPVKISQTPQQLCSLSKLCLYPKEGLARTLEGLSWLAHSSINDRSSWPTAFVLGCWTLSTITRKC